MDKFTTKSSKLRDFFMLSVHSARQCIHCVILAYIYGTDYCTKKHCAVETEGEREGERREAEGRAAWALIGHMTGAVDSGVRGARR